MSAGIYNYLIQQNVAPLGTRRIVIYDENGNRAGQIPLSTLMPPDAQKKLYSFVVLSDVHLSYSTGESDFRNALNFCSKTDGIDFVCISGDLSQDGTDARLSRFSELVNVYSPDVPVYVSAGNHDAYDADWNLRSESEVSASMQTHTGNPLYYSFEHKGDVFIFVGICEGTFSTAELDWLESTLETYKNKRCFLFQHAFAFEGSGNVFGLYSFDMLDNDAGARFKNILQKYPNVIWFHGHSHTKFHGQEFGDTANLDRYFGCWSVHVPSIAVPRTDADGDMEFQTEYQDSEGYVIDVYKNGIHLRGRDFVKCEFLPIASYWLDT